MERVEKNRGQSTAPTNTKQHTERTNKGQRTAPTNIEQVITPN